MNKIDRNILRETLAHTIEETDFPQLGKKHRGKVRDSYISEGKRTIVVTDRISAFDVVLGTVPCKGQVLNGIAAYWFSKTAHVAANHLLSVPDPNVSVVQQCEVFPVEMIVRAYLTGTSSTSIWTHYQQGARSYCGHRLPDGLKKHQRLEQPIVTPTTKAAEGQHDELTSAAALIAQGVLSADRYAELERLCLAMFNEGTRLAAERGLILVDTKYELGINSAGQPMFVDEIHTPDSSRYWYSDGYQVALEQGSDPRPLDKDFLRQTLIARGYRGDGPPPKLDEQLRLDIAERYLELYQTVTGQPLAFDPSPPRQRILTNLLG
ncbi:MAG: phosphoribosylaminoimidazolesuccinocarboxamide synthase [Deltaproteobacteria bacterium]|nr:phosphoribosylaminoimidazolesuccinocarboxamide synthase [Deltaproteobacteria bacterium]